MKKSMKFALLGFLALLWCLLMFSACGGNDVHVHSYSEWTITKAATCATDGIKERDCSCGDIQTVALPATWEHQYGEWTITKSATCTEGGEQSRVCSCGDKQISVTSTIDHSWNQGDVIVEATCTNEGIKNYTCSACGIVKTENLSKKEHSKKTNVILEPTCATAGKQEVVCSVCNAIISTDPIAATGKHTYDSGVTILHETCTSAGTKKFTCSTCGMIETETIDALGHLLNMNSVCTRCGLTTISMTSKEIQDSENISSMSHSVAEYSEELSIYITLKDKDKYALQVPTYVAVKIVDEHGNIVYDKTVVKKASQDEVVIDYKELTLGSTNVGTLYYTVYNDCVTFSEMSKELTKLPWTVDVELPVLPAIVWYHDISSCKITDISYRVTGLGKIYFYFTGEKIYDKKGDNYSSSCYIGWKLYDSDGYVVEDSTSITNSLKVGEKFKNDEDYTFYTVEKGKSYRLEIINID